MHNGTNPEGDVWLTSQTVYLGDERTFLSVFLVPLFSHFVYRVDPGKG